MGGKDQELILEEDEMEDGSIFVCFMCEKEFKKVSLLNEHMKMHENMPEMVSDLPRRRGRGSRGGKRGGGMAVRGRRGRGMKRSFGSMGAAIIDPDSIGDMFMPGGVTIKQEPGTEQVASRNVKFRKKLIVKEVVYEEVEEDEEEEEEEEEEVDENIQQQQHYSEPSTVYVKTEQDYADEENVFREIETVQVMDFPAIQPGSGYVQPKKPGRRSQPRSSDEEQGIPCEVCGKEFRTMTTLKVHLKAHLEVKDLPCPYCDEFFPQRHLLHQHLLQAHEEASNLTCPVCQKVFTRSDSLKSHMVRMHQEDGGLNCSICGKNFPNQGQLEMHVRVHTGERPFKCDQCGKGFVQKVHLRTHLRTMHNVEEIERTPCRLCNAMLDGRAGLRDHYTNEHDLTTNQYKSKVAKLRKEGKIPEVLPPVVKSVDPQYNYVKVNVQDLSGYSDPQVSKGRGKANRNNTKSLRNIRKGNMDDTDTSEDNSLIMSHIDIKVENEEPKPRDQEELSLVESAFKVAEQMDQMGGGTTAGSTTILVAGEDSATTGVYYAIPVVMDSSAATTTTTTHHTTTSTNGAVMVSGSTNTHAVTSLNFQTSEEIDDEYAQFAAEHAHIGSECFDEGGGGGSGGQGGTAKGSIVKAEPLQFFSDPSDPSQSETVEMFTM